MVVIMQDTINLMNKFDVSKKTSYIKDMENTYKVLEVKQLENINYYTLEIK